jgi:hypothetical protein
MSWDWDQQRRDEKLARDIGEEVGSSVGEHLEHQIGRLSDDITSAIGYQSYVQGLLHDERMLFDTLTKKEKIEYLKTKALEQEKLRQQHLRMKQIQEQTKQRQCERAQEKYLAGELNWWQLVLSVFIRPLIGLISASLIVGISAGSHALNEVLGPFYFWIWILLFALIFWASKPLKNRVVQTFESLNKINRAVQHSRTSKATQKLMDARREFE